MTTETGHSVLLTQPYTAWTLWHVSTGDHSSNSNDCCCGSLSQLMTSAMGWGKGLSCCWCRSVHLSVSKTLEVIAQSGGPTDNNSACSYECFHSFVCPYMKKIRHAPPQSWALFPLKWHGCWPTPPHSLQQSHILGGWITAPGLHDLPGDRWKGCMQMEWRDTQLCKASVKGSMFCICICVLVLWPVQRHGRFLHLLQVKHARYIKITIFWWGGTNDVLYALFTTACIHVVKLHYTWYKQSHHKQTQCHPAIC